MIMRIDPLILAGVAIVAGFIGAHYWRSRSSVAYFIVQFLAFTILTGLLLAAGITPYRPGAVIGVESRRLFIGALQIIWWLAGAWLTVGFLRAFVVLSRQPQESKVLQDVLAALAYLAATFAIVAYVFNLPVTGLLATSGALAIVIGLALQSSLGDVFSGIVLNVAGHYRVGDWIVLDGDVQGTVLEMNWRATHILTPSQDIAIIPNSTVARSRLVNCNTPTKIHCATIHVKLEPLLTAAAGRTLLREVLLGSPYILRTPEPSVLIADISAEMIDYALTYSVSDISAVAPAQNELLDRVDRAVVAAGSRFSPRLGGFTRAAVSEIPQRLLQGISLFSTLTAEEKAALASQMRRQDYKSGDVVAKRGTVLEALYIVSHGVLAVSTEDSGRKIEIIRFAPGDYFGEFGLLAGEALNGEITALTSTVIYEISRDALSPLLKARPSMVEELSESLARRQLAIRTALNHDVVKERHEEKLADRIAANIRRLFSLR